jgi:hypothetical protein
MNFDNAMIPVKNGPLASADNKISSRFLETKRNIEKRQKV